MAEAPPGPRHLIVMGDYIDRGPACLGAFERVAHLRVPGAEVTRLLGNHEEFLDRFLTEDDHGGDFLRFWAVNGGLETLADMGVSPRLAERAPAQAIAQGRAGAPDWLRPGLAGLSLGLRLGGYLFVHAGVHPRYPLEDGDHQRFTTIRQPFLDGDGWIHDFAVVHGHSIVGPDVERHRIAVDSGAYYTGVLTCAELRADQVRFICATPAHTLDGLIRVRGRRPLSAERWRPLTGVTSQVADR
jgi:serine/threonine protein phosphatase 1